MTFRWIGRRDPQQRLVRVCSLLWGAHPQDGGHKHRLSVSIKARVFGFWRERDAWFLTVAGIRLHYKSGPRGVLV